MSEQQLISAIGIVLKEQAALFDQKLKDVVEHIDATVEQRLSIVAEASMQLSRRAATDALNGADAMLEDLQDFLNTPATIRAGFQSSNPLTRASAKSRLAYDLAAVLDRTSNAACFYDSLGD